MQGKNYLAFDIGASSGRAVIGTLAGNIISLDEVYRFDNGMTRIHGRYHWDIYHIFDNLKKGLGAAITRGRIPVSIGIDTWGVDYGLLDNAGHLLGLPYAYRDHRTDTVMDDLFGIIPKERLYDITGIQFLQFNTIFQVYAAVKERLPIMAMARDLLFIPDLLTYFLTGVKKTEFTFATTSQLCDPRTGTWSRELLETIGIPPGIMQDIVGPGTAIGILTEEITQETGMPQVTVTAVASHDTGSAIAAIPAEDDAFAYISSGTWSLMGIESDIPVISPLSMKLNFTNEGGVGGTFRVLKNIMGLWLLQECRRMWSDAGTDHSFPALVAMAAAAPPFRTLIDPDHPSLMNPNDMPGALARLAATANEPVMDQQGAFCRCIFESLALRYRQTLDQLRQISDKDIRRIHIIGGGSHNDLLCQFTANATGLPVIAGPAESTALGNIMVQAMAHGKAHSLADVRRIIRNSFTFRRFVPGEGTAWDAAYQRFLDCCERQGR